MRILLDECVPRRLRRELQGYEVRTVPEMGWASFKNGVLLASASGKFDVLVTTDQRLTYQQNTSGFEIAVVVLVARRNKLEQLVKVLKTVKPERSTESVSNEELQDRIQAQPRNKCLHCDRVCSFDLRCSTKSAVNLRFKGCPPIRTAPSRVDFSNR